MWTFPIRVQLGGYKGHNWPSHYLSSLILIWEFEGSRYGVMNRKRSKRKSKMEEQEEQEEQEEPGC